MQNYWARRILDVSVKTTNFLKSGFAETSYYMLKAIVENLVSFQSLLDTEFRNGEVTLSWESYVFSGLHCGQPYRTTLSDSQDSRSSSICIFTFYTISSYSWPKWISSGVAPIRPIGIYIGVKAPSLLKLYKIESNAFGLFIPDTFWYTMRSVCPTLNYFLPTNLLNIASSISSGDWYILTSFP